jgi:hypothetical protein
MDSAPNDLPPRVAVLEQIAKETRENIADLRTEMRQSLADSRAEMRQGFADLRTEMRQGFAEMRAEMRVMTSAGCSGSCSVDQEHCSGSWRIGSTGS